MARSYSVNDFYGEPKVEAMIGAIEWFARVAVPVCVVNSTQHIVAWNNAAEDYFDLDAEGVLGREWHSVIHTTGTFGCCALCRARSALLAGDLVAPVEVDVSVDGYHQRVTMLPVPLGFDVDQTIGFMIMAVGSVLVPAVAPVKTPIPINSRVRHLSDDRIVENLTAREREVLACVIEGFDARTIAETIGITHATARNYVQRILTKLGARNKAEAVNVALRYNLLAS